MAFLTEHGGSSGQGMVTRRSLQDCLLSGQLAPVPRCSDLGHQLGSLHPVSEGWGSHPISASIQEVRKTAPMPGPLHPHGWLLALAW